MEVDKFELNKAYYQLHLKSTELASGLFHRIFEIESGWYHGKHLINADGQTYMSHFPLSVVSVKGYCDVEVDFDEIIVYTKLARKNAMQYSFEKFKDYPFEAYGTDDYIPICIPMNQQLMSFVQHFGTAMRRKLNSVSGLITVSQASRCMSLSNFCGESSFIIDKPNILTAVTSSWLLFLCKGRTT